MMSRRSSAVLYAILGLSVLFVTPAWANHIDSADATMTCSTFSLTVSASALVPGTSYVIDFTIGISPGASGFPITGSIPFTATSSTFSDTVTGSFPTLVGTFTFSGTASLVNQNTIDIIFSPSTLTCAPPTQGCTPGFWKNNAVKNGGNLWIGFTPSELLSTAGFAVPASFSDGTTLADATLLSALRFQGGSTLEGASEILLRAAVAAILNAGQFGGSASGIIAEVNAALASNNRDKILALATTLDAANNLGCPLSNS